MPMPGLPGLRVLALRLGLAWVALAVVGFFAGSALIRTTLPLIAAVTSGLLPEMQCELALVEKPYTDQLQLTATNATPLLLAGAAMVPAGQQLAGSANVIHALVPLVILLSIVLGWPVSSLRQRLAIIVAGLAACALLLAATTPFQLAGHIEIGLQQLAARAGVDRAEPLTLTYMIFLESGGRWMLAVALAVLSVALGQLAGGGADPADSGASAG